VFIHRNAAAFQETFNRSGCPLLTDFDDPVQAAQSFAAWCERVTREDRGKAARFGHTQTWGTVSKNYLQQHNLKD
jgi:hypothetical protein